ncbi:hypothetical protein PoB_003860600 [Plakobranchus ocellatus]|uniref:SMB domain-containing protein n=1 Tax=Plakobranchus ocellatus TaxID=259542 RepID=A0AAV4ALR1_9GAST|nr:hypothetical protein PoB_003860600 [Plakobranchus ocellatus]
MGRFLSCIILKISCIFLICGKTVTDFATAKFVLSDNILNKEQTRKNISEIEEMQFSNSVSRKSVTVDMSSIYTSINSLASSTLDFTIPYQKDGCPDIATNFAYKNNLCEAEDSASYMQFAKARYSCVNRCGHKTIYGESVPECGCDQNCVIHGDCCRDMAFVCPKTYAKGMDIYVELGNMTSLCVDTNYRIFARHPSLFERTIDAEITTIKRQESLVYGIPQQKPLPLQPRTLEEYFKTEFKHLRVADHFREVIFMNLLTFLIFRHDKSSPYFLPRISFLNCESSPFPSSRNVRVAQILKWCRVKDVEDARTPFHRSCSLLQLISCWCDNDFLYRDHLHNVCLGQDPSVFKLSKQMLWNYQIQTFYNPSKESQCKLHISHESARFTSKAPRYMNQTADIQMTITPVFMQQRGNSDPIGDEWNFGNDEDAISRNFDYVVELTSTIEKRFHCSRLKNFLSECVLEECARGALLATDSRSQWQIGGRLCILPVLATVSQPGSSSVVPLCNCMRVVNALSDLHLWDAKLKVSEDKKCMIELKNLPPEIRPSSNAAEEDAEQEQKDKKPYSLMKLAKRQQPTLQHDIQTLLYQTASYCPGHESRYPFHVCFSPSEIESESKVCLQLSALGEDNSASCGVRSASLFRRKIILHAIAIYLCILFTTIFFTV